MLLDTILLILWGNYRKLAMALYDKPATNNSQCSLCFLRLPPPSPPPHFLCCKSDIWNRISHMKNWTWTTAICSQVAKHMWLFEAVGTGLWIKLYLPTDKAETQPGEFLKTRQTENTAPIISTKVTSWWEGQCFICCWSWKHVGCRIAATSSVSSFFPL